MATLKRLAIEKSAKFLLMKFTQHNSITLLLVASSAYFLFFKSDLSKQMLFKNQNAKQ